MALRPQDVEAVRVVSALLSDEGWPFVIVGARAPWILVAGQDRPHERSKDLVNLVEAFERYEEDDSRRFELVDTSVDDAPIAFDDAGAYLLGVDAARLARPKSREAIRAFLTRFTDEYAEPVSRALTEEQRIHSERRRVEVYRLFRVFGTGFGSL